MAAPAIGMIACTSFSSSNEASSAPDATADIATTADGGGGRDGENGGGDGAWVPCAQRPDDPAHFCEDFDNEGRIGYRWGAVQVGGWIDASPDARSAPRALLTHVDPGADDLSAYLHKVIDGADAGGKSKATVSAFVRVDRPPYAQNAGSYFQVLVLHFDRTCSGAAVQAYCVVSFDADGMLVLAVKNLANECGASKDYYEISTPLTFGQFVDAGFRHVVLEVARTSCGGTRGGSITLLIDGQRQGCQDLVVDPLERPLEVQLGIYTHAAPNPGDVSYDDVTIDFD